MSNLVIALRRSVGLLVDDLFVNNTDYDVRIEDVRGDLIAVLAPGCLFEAERDVTIYFNANLEYTFRSYLNQEWQREPKNIEWSTRRLITGRQ
jgi:hypothetical protein